MQPAVLPEPGFSWLECHQHRVSVSSDNTQLTLVASGPLPRARWHFAVFVQGFAHGSGIQLEEDALRFLLGFVGSLLGAR